MTQITITRQTTKEPRIIRILTISSFICDTLSLTFASLILYSLL